MDRCDCFGQRQSDVAGRAVLDSGWVVSPLRLEVTSHRLCIAQQQVWSSGGIS